MWPLISPPKGAFSSFMRALMREWPVLNITGSPPEARMLGANRCEHFTSNKMGAPGWRVSTSWANNIIWRSGKMFWPLGVTIPRRSPSPSKAKPNSAPVEARAAIKSWRFSGLLGSGWWLGKVPSTSEKSSITSHPKARKTAGAVAPATPLPESITTFMGRAKRTSWVMVFKYASHTWASETLPPDFCSQLSACMICRKR